MMGRTKMLFVLFVLFFLIPSLANAREYTFQKTKGITVDVLSERDFTAKFGNNPEIPRTDADVIALARRLYPSQEEKRRMKVKQIEEIKDTEWKECGTHDTEVLFAALKNPAISDTTRNTIDAIIAESEPVFNEPFVSGHFKFYYTDNCKEYPNDCVTEAEIIDTATWLNKWWDMYVTSFTIPLCDPKDPNSYIINVKIYYLGEGNFGVTNREWDHIVLNNKLTIQDNCERRTTSAHELFHRVQYSYGLYANGFEPNMEWLEEGTAAWSQKFTNEEIRDYMERMDMGLSTPQKSLITERSYDASLFWIYLEERTN